LRVYVVVQSISTAGPTPGTQSFKSANGARFGCKQRVEIGAHSIIAECRISDYDFHSVNPEHRDNPAYIGCRPVTIGENVWITRDCYIQKGVTIGRDSTIAPMSLVRTGIPERCVAGGNPAVVLKTLPPAEQGRLQ
jgi:acetyltransferase-like isoleucine patch superfamily enzyme